MTFIADKTDTLDVVQRWPYGFQYIDDGDPLYNYVGAFASELHYIDTLIDTLYEQRFLESATGRELEKLAADVGLGRRGGEADDSLRLRTQLRKAVAASDGTADDIEGIVELAFGAENLEDIDVSHDSGHPVTRFDIPQTYIDDIPLTQTEFQEELERAFPAGHGVIVVTSDTWLLGESGAQGLGQGGLL